MIPSTTNNISFQSQPLVLMGKLRDPRRRDAQRQGNLTGGKRLAEQPVYENGASQSEMDAQAPKRMRKDAYIRLESAVKMTFELYQESKTPENERRLLRAKVKQFEALHARWKEKQSDSAKEIARLKAKSEEAESLIQKHLARFQQYIDEREQLQTEFQQQTSEKEKLEHSLREVSHKYDILKDELDVSKEEIQALKTDNQLLQARLASIGTQCQNISIAHLRIAKLAAGSSMC